MDKWVTSDWKDAEGATGKFEISAGQFYKDEAADKGTNKSRNRFSSHFPNLPI